MVCGLVRMVNLQAHEVLSLEVLHVLLENPTNDSVELAIGFLKECGQLLTKVSPKGVNGKSVCTQLCSKQ